MPRSPSKAFGLLVLLGCCAGCFPPAPAPLIVWVDKQSVQLNRPDEASYAASVPGSTSAVGGVKAMPGLSLLLGESQEMLDRAHERVQNETARTAAKLENVLADQITQSSENERIARLSELSDEEQRIWDHAMEAIRNRFAEYTERHGVIRDRLSDLVSWPDPGPRQVNPTDQRAVERESKAQALRIEQDALDSAFRSDRAKILRDLEGEIDKMRASTVAVVNQKHLDELDRMKRFIETLKRTKGQLIQGEAMKELQLSLTDVPAAQADLAATGSALTNIPAVRQNHFESEALESDLKIWAGLNNYKIASTPRGAVDKTVEFAAWRNSIRPGH